MTQPLADRFWAKVQLGGSDECWPWSASTNKGYGQINIGGRPRAAHRVAYELTFGPIPAGQHLDHLCHTRDTTCMGGDSCPHRRCCNPAHHEPVDQVENIRRGRSPQASTRRGARVTHCKHGHEYTDANTITTKRGRSCRECNRIDARERGRRKRAAERAA